MTDHNGHPQQPQPGPRTWGVPQQTAPSQQVPPTQATSPVEQTPPVQQAPAAVPVEVSAPQVPQTPQVFQADQAWVDGYEPGNPWQARLCMETPYGTFTYPLTPHTMPELLEQMVLVAQEQQGLPVGFDADPETGALPEDGEDADADQHGQAAGLHGGRAARLTGWALVHDLWEREDPTARIVMGAVVVVLLLLGVFLT
ncbi:MULTISPECIES: hypothetical protein [Streptomyces]|uniref:Uncharacterized protein n=2 Tax=Streptomyces bottropensis TaxID=42235 RepID=M3EA38_9ACTN|nr:MULTISPECIES: hypothetical protein [Streptomyces]EMF53041.1 hypothetical protein SBD_6117 [Streptomyces bottropensis ATCC 25435]MZD22077.1 hypothetical protein [Streptomyces sp. SID5476]